MTVLARESVSVPPSTTVRAVTTMATVVTPSIAGGSYWSTTAVVRAESMEKCPHSVATSPLGGPGDDARPTTVWMIPALPEPDSPCGVASAAAGSASAAHCGGYAVHPGENPQNLAGEAVPRISATSKPVGNAPRIRRMLSGVIAIGRFDDGCAGVDVRDAVGRWGVCPA